MGRCRDVRGPIVPQDGACLLGWLGSCCYSPAAERDAGSFGSPCHPGHEMAERWLRAARIAGTTDPNNHKSGHTLRRWPRPRDAPHGSNEYANPAHADQFISRSRAAIRPFAGATGRYGRVESTRRGRTRAAAAGPSRFPGPCLQGDCPTPWTRPRQSPRIRRAARPACAAPLAPSPLRAHLARCHRAHRARGRWLRSSPWREDERRDRHRARRPRATCTRNTPTRRATVHRTQT